MLDMVQNNIMRQVLSLDQEDPLEKQMATHSSILAWEISWTEEPCRPQSMGCKNVGHVLVTKQQQEVHRYVINTLKLGKFSPPNSALWTSTVQIQFIKYII